MTTTKNRVPTYRVYSVRGDADKARWTEIGAAWSTRDGMGYSLSLDAVPLGGRIIMLEAIPRSEAGGQS